MSTPQQKRYYTEIPAWILERFLKALVNFQSRARLPEIFCDGRDKTASPRGSSVLPASRKPSLTSKRKQMGWFRPVHAKSTISQEVRALLVACKQLQGKLIDVELSIRGILRGFGLKVGHVTRKSFEARIQELVAGQAMLERIAGAMLSTRATLQAEFNKLHKALLSIVRADAVCRKFLMTVPGVGPVGGRSNPHQKIEGGRRIVWADAEEIPIGRN